MGDWIELACFLAAFAVLIPIAVAHDRRTERGWERLDEAYGRPLPAWLRDTPANDNVIALATPDALTVPQLGHVQIRVRGERDAA